MMLSRSKWMAILSCTVVVATTLFASAQEAGPTAPPEKVYLRVGVCTHFGSREGIVPNNLQMMKQAGIDSIRDEVSWGSVERKKGQLIIPEYDDHFVDEAIQHGIEPILILSYDNPFYGKYRQIFLEQNAFEPFTKYAEFVVRHFKGKVHTYEVWNEWHTVPYDAAINDVPGGTRQYLELIKMVGQHIKAIDPSIKVIAGYMDTYSFGNAGKLWLESLCKLGLLDHIDGYSVHPYNFSDMAAGGTPEAWLQQTLDLQALFKKYGKGRDIPLYVTEMGWPNDQWQVARSPEVSAEYLARLYLLARTVPYVKGIWWYDFQDDGWDPNNIQHNFGIVRPDLTPMAPYYALKMVAPVVAHARYVGRVKTSDSKLWILHFRTSENKDIWAMWTEDGPEAAQVVLESSATAPTPLSYQRAGYEPVQWDWGYRDWPANRNAVRVANETRITVRTMPALLSGDLSHVRVKGVQRRQVPLWRGGNIQLVRHPFVALASRMSADRSAWDASMKWTEFGGLKHWRSTSHFTSYAMPAGFDARFAARWDVEHLYLAVEVTDSVHHAVEQPTLFWSGDSIQLAVQTFTPGGLQPPSYTELGAALTGKGPLLYRYRAQSGAAPGLMKDADVWIERKENHTIYHLKLPLKSMDLPPMRDGSMIGFSLLVNDNDGKGRDGFLHWSSGIGISKNPNLYGWLVMTP